jgi:hypothetical protein
MLVTWNNAAVRHCLSCYVFVVQSAVSIKIELGSTGFEVAKPHENTVVAGGYCVECPRCPAVADTMVIKSYVLNL